MAVESSRFPVSSQTVSRYRNLIVTVLAGAFMILLARFWLDGVIAGMFGVWGISLIAVGVGGHLLLRFWGAYNR